MIPGCPGKLTMSDQITFSPFNAFDYIEDESEILNP